MTSEIELYFHIPFCVRKCFYCDFLSAPADAHIRTAYMKALKGEAVGRAAEYAGRPVISLFIGGGTPSAVEAEQIAALLQAVREHYNISENAEITIEVNPGTADPEKFKVYRAAGINRLSIGLQSADDGELAALGRIHNWKQFMDTYEAAAEAGFTNVNVDIMSALPGQTPESYRRTLQKVLELKPRPVHISAYSLILEEGTQLWEQAEQGRLVLPDEDADREMYSETKRVLEQTGYARYEISNYAMPGHECRHNCGYWQRRDYVGFGIGAASLINNARFRNKEDLRAYLDNPLGCRENRQILSREEQMEEFIFLGLRMTAGISEKGFADCFGRELCHVYGDVIKKNEDDGLLEWKGDGSRRCLVLTEKGLDLANYVMAQFLL